MVIFDGDRKVFKLDTDNTSYVMGITEEGVSWQYILWQEGGFNRPCVCNAYR